mmetsp:Transcript_9397/g.20832  ORF Transcript_9397/g.20832 Transcript_9397/m.20832 type:complete len:520 (+) Transcript_9397:246-1805(+)
MQSPCILKKRRTGVWKCTFVTKASLPFSFSMGEFWSPPSDTVVVDDRSSFFSSQSVIDWEKWTLFVPPDSHFVIKTPSNLEPTKVSLMKTKGSKTVLVVRVLADDVVTTVSAYQLSNNWFGTGDDAINFRSKTMQCSYGKLIFNPAPSSALSTGIRNGVVTIDLKRKVRSIENVNVMVIENMVKVELVKNLGPTYTSNVDHIALCMPRGLLKLAYGYYNGKISVYNDKLCLSSHFQMHEIGHNLNLDHSGTPTRIYGDKTCIMGLTYRRDTNICFNAPKSWALGWYDDRHRTIGKGQVEWTGAVVGLSDYGISNGYAVLLKIMSNTADFYVNYNRAIGINKDTKLGLNKVMVFSTEPGVTSSKSILIRQLEAGQCFSRNQRFSSSGIFRRLTISVLTINTSASPSFATVHLSKKICKDDESFKFIDRNGARKRGCAELDTNLCNSWDQNGKLMKNYCSVKCDFCRDERCVDDKSFFLNMEGGKMTYSCKTLPLSNCKTMDNKNRLVKEFCRRRCSFCCG